MSTTRDKQQMPVAHGGLHILVVEDNATNQQVACAILKHAGYVADVVVDGRAAIKALESKPYDLVLMDCCLPVMDGFEATRAIRAPNSRVLNPKIPIIALTALAMSEDRQKCLEAGMDNYVSKPVNPSRLMSAIEQCMEPAGGKDSTGAPRGAVPVSTDPATTGFELPPELLENIIELFLEDAPKQIAQLQVALQSGDSESLRAVSHKIRGSADVLGTASISALAKEVEAAARRGDLKRTGGLTPKLIKEVKRLLTELAGADD